MSGSGEVLFGGGLVVLSVMSSSESLAGVSNVVLGQEWASSWKAGAWTTVTL